MRLKKCIPLFGITMAILTAIPVSASNMTVNSNQSLSQLSSTKETEKSTTSKSDSDEQIEAQSGDDSGMIYDFKDSKTTGVVTATKTWEDSLSNDEYPVPDISISTEKPSKSTFGYGITYHGNGLTFEDGSKVNDIVVNKSGKIISGQYKELLGSLGWYTDSDCTNKIELDSDGLPMNGVTSDLDLYAKTKTFVLKKGSEFYSLIPSTATSVVFTDETMPTSATLIDVDADGDGGVVAWMDGTTLKVSTQIKDLKAQANPDSKSMFSYKSNLKNINLTMLDTRNVTDMGSMFSGCSGLTALDLTHLDTRNVTKMDYMFYGCSGLTALDLAPLNTQNVTNMEGIFSLCKNLTSLDISTFDTSNVTNMCGVFNGCSSLTELNLSHIKTSNVKTMNAMFYGCEKLIEPDLSSFDTSNITDMIGMFMGCDNLISLNLSSFNTSKVTSMRFMFSNDYELKYLTLSDTFVFVGDYFGLNGNWCSTDGTIYTCDGKTCTIPNNKADIYTRK